MALAGFRHKYMSHNIDLPASQADRDWERRGYYNGRTEPLWLGEIRNNRYYPIRDHDYDRSLFQMKPVGPYHLIDARSYYGAVATFQAIPIACEAEGDGWPDSDGQHPPLDCDYMAEVEIQSDNQEFPVRLPDRTCFARGHYSTVLCGPELARAVNTGSIVHVGHWRRYTTETALRAWGLGLWADRLAAEQYGDKILATLCKGLMARLHGKFMQRANRWVLCPSVMAPAAWHNWQVLSVETGKLETYRSIGWDVQRQEDAGDATQCFPAIAAYVTAYGREWMRTWMRLAGADQVLYVSTDAMICTDLGRRNLENSGIIGEHGIGSCRVVESSDDVAIYAANWYSIGGKHCYAGLPVGSVGCRDRTITYYRRAGAFCSRASAETQSITETQETAQIEVAGDDRRLTETGWLTPLYLYDGAEAWTSARIPSRM